MYEQYKKTVIPTQIIIAVVCLAVLLMSHRLSAALAFFLVMQAGALFGAVWGARLKHKIERMPQR
jgi:O-antigen/teichoic acid export membrane protein